MNLTKSVFKQQIDICDTWAIWGGIEKQYRYILYREWNPDLPRMVIIGLNPSAADEKHDDRTVRKCITFARREGYGSLYMLNIFAFRATNPKELITCLDPVGVGNNFYTLWVCGNISKIICAWGIHGRIFNRNKEVLKLLKYKQLFCFGMNKDGSPKHPLYLSNNTKLEMLKNP